MAYDFHYTPTGTGVISGKEVLEQTEDAINDLGNTAISGVQEALDKAEQALTNSANAVDDAQTALNTANNAEGVAIQAQTDVGNLSGTVTNIGNRVTTAEGNISNLQGRMTTAEGNITNLQGRMTTAETNIGNLQTAVSTAQATANSAQQTATTARQQSYVFRYSGTAITDNSTIAYSTIDNTDNIKSGDKILDVDGKLFEITAVDTTNQTVTVGSALVDLALDANVVHTSGNETVGGQKTFSSDITLQGTTTPVIKTISNIIQDSTGGNESISWVIRDKTDSNTVFSQSVNKFSGQSVDFRLDVTSILNGTSSTRGTRLVVDPANESYRFTSSGNNTLDLGSSTNRWKSVYAMNYYYGSNNVEFSTKFVTTDTNQTITERKTFTKNVTIKNEDVTIGTTSGVGSKDLTFTDSADNALAKITGNKASNGSSGINFRVDTTDNNNVNINSQFSFFIAKSGAKVVNPIPDNDISLGRTSNRWKDTCTCLINGLTPSSLGMPVIDSTKYVDISGYFTNTGNGDINTYSVTANGWVYLRLTDIDGCQLSVLDSSNNRLYGSTSSGSLEQLCLPVTAGTVVETQWITSTSVTVAIARFIPCQGNI